MGVGVEGILFLFSERLEGQRMVLSLSFDPFLPCQGFVK